MHEIALEIHNLTVSYNKKPVLYGIDVSIPKGSLVAIMGPNGAGKSTLIKTALGMIVPSSGDVAFFGKSFKSMKGKIGYVPQRETVDWDFPVSVYDVVMMGRYTHMKFWGRPKALDKEKVMYYLNLLGMDTYAARQISKLSGGQQQRVFLARALAQESELYFMDEPLAAVDAITEQLIIKCLKHLQSEGKTVIVVHHDLTTAKAYFDHILFVNMRLIAFGSAETIFTEQNLQNTYGGRLGILSEVAMKGAQVRSHTNNNL